MPFWQNTWPDSDSSARWANARAEVRAKFPALIEGSSGWHRAVNNRFKRQRG